MARLVKVTGVKPVRIDPQATPVFVCACGLTKNFPFCDGHHKACAGESPDATYVYDEDSSGRREVECANPAARVS